VGSLAVRCDEGGADRRQVRGVAGHTNLSGLHPRPYHLESNDHRQKIGFGRDRMRLLYYVENLPVSFSICDAGPNRDTRR